MFWTSWVSSLEVKLKHTQTQKCENENKGEPGVGGRDAVSPFTCWTCISTGILNRMFLKFRRFYGEIAEAGSDASPQQWKAQAPDGIALPGRLQRPPFGHTCTAHPHPAASLARSAAGLSWCWRVWCRELPTATRRQTPRDPSGFRPFAPGLGFPLQVTFFRVPCKTKQVLPKPESPTDLRLSCRPRGPRCRRW